MNNITEQIHSSHMLYERLLSKFIAAQGVSESGIGINQASSFLVDLLKKYLDAQVTLIKTSSSPAIVATIDPGQSQTILFYGHYDVMPVAASEQWLSDPFKLAKRNDCYYGRGCGDDKGQLLAQICGLITYRQLYGQLPVTVKLFYEGQEEIGSLDLKSSVEQAKKAGLLNGVDYAIISDGTISPDGRHVITLGNRGGLGFRITVNENHYDLHSGNFGNVAPNAAIKLMQLLNRMIDFKSGRCLLPKFYDGIVQPTQQELAWIDKLPSPVHSPFSKREYYQRLMFTPTINVNGIASGHVGQRIKTIIPGRATAMLDIRLVKGQQCKQIEKTIQQALAPELNNRRAELEFLVETSPSKSSPNIPIVNTLIQAVKHATGDCLIEPVAGGTVPNYVWESFLGVPVVSLPLGAASQNAHAANENMPIHVFDEDIAIIAHLMAILANR